MNVVPVILAAGQGKRMRSSLPKVLQPLAEQTLIEHVLDTVEALRAGTPCVVVGHGAAQVESRLQGRHVRFVHQPEQLGTGHALAMALPSIPDDHVVLVLYGDVPLVTSDTLSRLLELAGTQAVAWLTAVLPDPSGFGRILRDDQGRVVGIVEEKDATPSQRELREVNTGILAANSAALKRWTAALGRDNAQGEYYLTDCLGMAVAEGVPIHVHRAVDHEEVLGINDKYQLAGAEAALRRRRARQLLAQGVTLRDPSRVDVRGRVTAGVDVEIDVGVILRGTVRLGDGCRIGPYCLLHDCEIGAGVSVEAHSILEGASVGAQCRVGPFARLRPGAQLAHGARVGNFVEIKQSALGAGSKVNHLSYIGDAHIGRDVNIGAGTITCNYDGVNKHRTVIGDRAFIGSNTALVAPVDVGDGATIGAGSVITRSAPPEELTLARARQVTVKGWKRPQREKE